MSGGLLRGLRKAAPALTATAISVGTLTALASLTVAAYFARRVLTPESERSDDTWILEVGEDTITLRAEAHTVSPGRYGVWLDGGDGHLRVGDVVGSDLSARRPIDRTVVRQVETVDAGTVEPGPARWNGYYYAGDPSSTLGYDYDDVTLTSDVGELPAWKVRPDGADQRRWAILIHGRSARRDETLRALPVLRELGITALVPMYRNDEGAPASADGRYNLGLSEWRDIEASIRYAVSHGARDVVLFGWSMGGATALQTLDRSDLRSFVSALVLDCPVIDWGDVLHYQADLNRLPRSAAYLATALMGRRSTRFLVGVGEPLDIATTNWVERAEELTHPILLMHSRTDETVPHGPSERLAARRPDLVELDLWDGPLHCRLWNVDSDRWEQRVRAFLSSAT